MSKQVFNNNKWGIALKSVLISLIFSLVFTSVIFAAGGGRYEVDPWAFGLMGDTQWTVEGNKGDNPNYVSAAVARELNKQFIDAGVKFVIQNGDLTDRAGADALATRAEVAQELYDEEIGFFPIRGNHETYGWMYFLDPDNNINIPAFKTNFPQTQGLANTFGTTNFSSPPSTDDIMKGLSYSFDFGDAGNNARFVFVDVEATKISTTTPAAHATYGAGAFYFGFTVYKYNQDLQGTTGAMVDGVWMKVPATIPAGEYFRISGGKPCTDFYGWNNGMITKYNADGNIWPIADNLSYVTAALAGEYWPAQQQEWISGILDKETRGTEHAFVFSHRPMMGANHVDYFFGPEPKAELAPAENAFYASLMNNGVKYMLSAHDHIYNRAIVTSPDGLSEVEQLISIGASTKFYSPAGINSFPDGMKDREEQISQEINNIGYYIYTVDGPRVTVDYYSDSVGNFMDGDNYPDGSGSLEVPDFDFVRKETWGYSHNGQQFVISQSGSYTIVQDSFGTTTTKILAGTNNSNTVDLTPTVINDNDTPDDTSDDVVLSAPRKLIKTVNTGWVNRPNYVTLPVVKNFRDLIYFLKAMTANAHNKLQSDIMSLWGMGELGKEKTEEYVLSMSYDTTSMYYGINNLMMIKNGKAGIATYVNGKWVNAVNENFGGKAKFVLGPYKAKYGLGTYGIDPKTNTAWAVLNYNADFAVATNVGPACFKK